MAQRVIDMLQNMRRIGMAIPIAINAPASTLSDERAVDFLLDRIHVAELPASLLRVELTEDQPIRELEALRAAQAAQNTAAATSEQVAA